MAGLARVLPGLPIEPAPPVDPAESLQPMVDPVSGFIVPDPRSPPVQRVIEDQITGYRYGRYRDNLAALRVARVQAYDELIDALQRETGTRLANPMDERFLDPTATPGYLADRYQLPDDPVTQFEARVLDLVRGRPELERYIAMANREAIRQRADALRTEVTNDFHNYLGTGSALDQFMRGLALTPGLITGALSTGSPEQVAQLAAGGAGRGMNIAERFVAGAASNVVAQAAIEPALIEDAERMGEQHDAPMIALDFTIAALFGGTIEAAIGHRPSTLRDTTAEVRSNPDAVARFTEPGSGSAMERAAAGRAESLIFGAHQRDRITALELPQETTMENLVDEINANDRFVRGEEATPTPAEALPRPDPRELEAAVRQADDSPAPPAGTREMVTVNGNTRPRTFEQFRPSTLGFDPATFQYKRSEGAQGSTGRLDGVDAWDSQSAGKVVVWERADGRLFVADGHQRTALAQRFEARGDPVTLDGYRYREADGWTAREVRNIAAQKNLRETPGDVLDTASLMRDAPELIDGSIPQRGAEFRQAKALARLSDGAYAAVRAGQIDTRLGAIIGDVAGDRPEVHESLVQLFQRNPPATLRDAAFIAREATMSAVHRAETAQLSMFGDELVISGMQERAAIIRNATAMLREDKRVFRVAERHSDALEAAGNVLAAEANARRVQLADALVAEIDVLATRPGPVSTLLREIATRAAEHKTSVKDAAREFVTGMEALLEERGLLALRQGSDAPAVTPPPPKIPEMMPRLTEEARGATLRDAHDLDEEAFDQALAEVALERAMRGEVGDVIPEDAIGNTPEADLARIEDAAEALGIDADFTEMQVAAAIYARPDAAMEAEARARLMPQEQFDEPIDLEALRTELEELTIAELRDRANEEGLVLRGRLGKGDIVNRFIAAANDFNKALADAGGEPIRRPMNADDVEDATFADVVEHDADIEPPFQLRDFDSADELRAGMDAATLPELEAVARAEGVGGIARTRADYVKLFTPTMAERAAVRRALKADGFDVGRPLYHGAAAAIETFEARPLFLTPERSIAEIYASPAFRSIAPGAGVVPVYVRRGRALVVRERLPAGAQTAIIERARRDGYDTIDLLAVNDDIDADGNTAYQRQIIVLDPANVRRLEAADSAGTVAERFRASQAELREQAEALERVVDDLKDCK